MYNNEVNRLGQRGFWLIDDRGQKTPAYHSHSKFLTGAREWVALFKADKGRVPTPVEFSTYVVRLRS